MESVVVRVAADAPADVRVVDAADGGHRIALFVAADRVGRTVRDGPNVGRRPRRSGGPGTSRRGPCRPATVPDRRTARRGVLRVVAIRMGCEVMRR